MGLDGIELILAVEEEFKIAISDDDAVQCVTVGKLVDVVHSRLRHSAAEPCASQHGFYIVRRILMDVVALDRSQIKPETRLEDLIDRSHRREVWRKVMGFVADQKTTWHSLVRPKWLNLLLVLVLPGLVCFGIVIFTWWSFVMALPVAMVIAFLGFWITAPFKQEFPRKFTYVKDLIKFVRTLDSRTWTKEDVFQKIRSITVEQLGVKESQVTLETDFVKDLGVG